MTEENKTTFLSHAFNGVSEFAENVKNKALGLTGAFMGRATEFGIYIGTGLATSSAVGAGTMTLAGAQPLHALAMAGFMSVPLSLPIGLMIMDRAGVNVDRIGENIEGYFDKKCTDHLPRNFYDGLNL